MTKLALGIMSGTSGDGVSLALCSFQGRSLKIHHYTTYSYPSSLSKQLSRCLKLKTSDLSALNFELGNYFADCAVRFLKKTKSSKKVAVIGSHGHTVYHGPRDPLPSTFQIGEPSFIAEKTGIPVVSDFRPRDMAAGGEGAPLIPFFDQYFFGNKNGIALQNIGGIGNVTFIPPSPSSFLPLKMGEERGGGMIAFDTGPGNCLMDLAIQKITRGRKSFDQNGEMASKGWIDLSAIQKMIRHPFFNQKPPKSTGRELFNQIFLRHVSHLKSEDQLATLTFFTAYSIYISYQKFLPKSFSKLIVSGGGSKNPVLMNDLRNLFGAAKVFSIEKLGIPTQAKEPAAFAFFAWQAIHKKVNHCPEGTGAKGVRILGKITY